MNVYLLILLRLIHVVAGILWGGAAIFYLFFVKPSVKSIGAAGPQFMQKLVERQRYPLFMISTSTLTILAGGILFWLSSGGFNLFWIQTGPRIGFTIGSLVALFAFIVGNFVIGPTAAKMSSLGLQIAMSGGSPNSGLIVEMQKLEKRLTHAENWDFILLVISMLTMATARYWTV